MGSSICGFESGVRVRSPPAQAHDTDVATQTSLSMSGCTIQASDTCVTGHGHGLIALEGCQCLVSGTCGACHLGRGLTLTHACVVLAGPGLPAQSSRIHPICLVACSSSFAVQDLSLGVPGPPTGAGCDVWWHVQYAQDDGIAGGLMACQAGAWFPQHGMHTGRVATVCTNVCISDISYIHSSSLRFLACRHRHMCWLRHVQHLQTLCTFLSF